MKKYLKMMIISLLTVCTCKVQQTEVLKAEINWTSNVGTYYAALNESLTGNALLKNLQSINDEKQKKTVGYSNLWNYYSQTDYAISNKNLYNVFYRGTAASKGEMNKEHVWPKSHGGNLVEGDLHMTRPTLTADNSSRGNSFYVEGMKSSSQGWDPVAEGMNPIYRGIAARIIFYCCVAESRLSLVDTNYSQTRNASPDYKMGKLSDLLKWNLEYEVDQTELNRNVGVQNIQGNRNPFIDNPGFACAIWGNTNTTTQAICKNQSGGGKSYNVTFKANNGDADTVSSVTSGKTVSEPSITKSNAKLVGWYEDPMFAKEYSFTTTVTKDITLYARWTSDIASTSDSFTLVKSVSELKDGDKIILANGANKVAAGSLDTQILTSVSATISNDVLTANDAEVFTLRKTNSVYKFETSEGYLGATGAKKLSYADGTNEWSLSIDSSGNATITNSTTSYGTLQYNSSSPRFTTYTTAQQSVQIYKQQGNNDDDIDFDMTASLDFDTSYKDLSEFAFSNVNINYYNKIEGYTSDAKGFVYIEKDKINDVTLSDYITTYSLTELTDLGFNVKSNQTTMSLNVTDYKKKYSVVSYLKHNNIYYTSNQKDYSVLDMLKVYQSDERVSKHVGLVVNNFINYINGGK